MVVFDKKFQALLERIAESRKHGERMEKGFELAEAFLAAQPAAYANSRCDELWAQVKMFLTQAPPIEQMFSAKTDQEG